MKVVEIVTVVLEVVKGANKIDVLREAVSLCLLHRANVEFVFNGDKCLVSYEALMDYDGYKVSEVTE